jgi:23S rRNA-/tRNA-specific pseudouridylate synthase
VLEQLQSAYDKEVRVVHRLDRDASGLLVFARDQQTAALLSDGFRDHSIKRQYRAHIGVPLPVGTSGIINEPLKWAGGRCWVDASGARAVTHYDVVARESGYSVLSVTLETGRMHQIRVHLSHALAPIIGDRKYGGPKADTLHLTAVRLEFAHPDTGKWLCFEVKSIS